MARSRASAPARPRTSICRDTNSGAIVRLIASLKLSAYFVDDGRSYSPKQRKIWFHLCGKATSTCSQFLFQQLFFPQLRVQPSVCQQFVVLSLFNDVSIVEHQYQICSTQHGNPMRRDQTSLSRHEPLQVNQDIFRRVRIHGGERIIQQKDIRIAKDGARKLTLCFCPPDNVTPRSPTMVS